MVFYPFPNQKNVTTSKKRTHIHDGTTKILMDGPQEDSYVLHFKDTLVPDRFIEGITSNNSPVANLSKLQKANELVLPGKGVINNRLSEMFFTRLSERRIYNHFMTRLNMKEQQVRACMPLPFKVVVHNFSCADFAKRMDISAKHLLPEPVVEFVHKLKSGEQTFISERHILAFNMATTEEIEEIITKTQRINDFLSGQFLAIGIKLINFSIEFGRFSSFDYYIDSDLLVIDEITPDTMCLWDIKTDKVIDRISILEQLASSKEVTIYQDIAKRFDLI
jgi:phosphoribosylaminoimidazole-succinocarboxamide synthase